MFFVTIKKELVLSLLFKKEQNFKKQGLSHFSFAEKGHETSFQIHHDHHWHQLFKTKLILFQSKTTVVFLTQSHLCFKKKNKNFVVNSFPLTASLCTLTIVLASHSKWWTTCSQKQIISNPNCLRAPWIQWSTKLSKNWSRFLWLFFCSNGSRSTAAVAVHKWNNFISFILKQCMRVLTKMMLCLHWHAIAALLFHQHIQQETWNQSGDCEVFTIENVEVTIRVRKNDAWKTRESFCSFSLLTTLLEDTKLPVSCHELLVFAFHDLQQQKQNNLVSKSHMCQCCAHCFIPFRTSTTLLHACILNKSLVACWDTEAKVVHHHRKCKWLREFSVQGRSKWKKWMVTQDRSVLITSVFATRHCSMNGWGFWCFLEMLVSQHWSYILLLIFKSFTPFLSTSSCKTPNLIPTAKTVFSLVKVSLVCFCKRNANAKSTSFQPRKRGEQAVLLSFLHFVLLSNFSWIFLQDDSSAFSGKLCTALNASSDVLIQFNCWSSFCFIPFGSCEFIRDEKLSHFEIVSACGLLTKSFFSQKQETCFEKPLLFCQPGSSRQASKRHCVTSILHHWSVSDFCQRMRCAFTTELVAVCEKKTMSSASILSASFRV